jgi:hypothetical protein
MPRQLYEQGSLSSQMEKMVQTIMEMTGVSREEAIRIIQTMENPQETMDDATMIQEGYGLEPRQEYGLGSIVKSISKGVKKVVSSDLGKAALLAAGGYYLGGGNLFGLQRAGMTGFKFGNLPGASVFQGGFSLNPFAQGSIDEATGAVTGEGIFRPLMRGINRLSTGQKIAGAIGGSSLLAGIFGTEEQAQELYERDPAEFNARVKQYTKNLNPNEEKKVIQQIQSDISKLGDVSQAEQIFKRNVAAEGGRVGFAEGSGGFESAKDFIESTGDDELMDMYIDVLKGIQPEEALFKLLRKKGYQTYATGGRVDYAEGSKGGIMGIPTGEMRQNSEGVIERDYRDEGGFVPVGIKEKADDVPAMLSKNEFVMTADAVKGAGNGDIEKGAQIMYDNMKRLESRVV